MFYRDENITIVSDASEIAEQFIAEFRQIHELSGLTGIPQHHISEMENGKRCIGKERAKKLAEALHCDYRQLL